MIYGSDTWMIKFGRQAKARKSREDDDHIKEQDVLRGAETVAWGR